MNVKVCGLTNAEDALVALEHGAHAIGFILNVPVDTPRKITLAKAVGIVEELSSNRGKIVAVMMNSGLKEVEEVFEVLKPDAFQFHGRETPAFLARVGKMFDVEVIKTIHVSGEAGVDWDYLGDVVENSDYLLLDTDADGKLGGTGKTHDWDLSLKVKEKTGKKIILSGGINKDNVLDAIRKVKPHCVDVSSSLESAPGRKDHRKIKEFMEAVKSA